MKESNLLRHFLSTEKLISKTARIKQVLSNWQIQGTAFSSRSVGWWVQHNPYHRDYTCKGKQRIVRRQFLSFCSLVFRKSPIFSSFQTQVTRARRFIFSLFSLLLLFLLLQLLLFRFRSLSYRVKLFCNKSVEREKVFFMHLLQLNYFDFCAVFFKKHWIRPRYQFASGPALSVPFWEIRTAYY